ncbi:MAG: hypothetical protein FH753_05555 [Firmicutes bacterium]|nr:hypothetical protein [Bacillota bacterium]
MSTSAVKLWELYEGLKNRFLFNNDINSIYVLLSLYDLEENISNIYPKYICSKNIKTRVKKILKERENRNHIAQSIIYAIRDDINRIELCFYLEGYKYGYFNYKWVNALEKKALDTYNIENIYDKNYLFHFDIMGEGVNNIKTKLWNEIDFVENQKNNINDLVYTFADKVIKRKINNLDKHADKQLKVDFNDFNIKEESYLLTKKETNNIYHAIVNVMIKNLTKIYKEASWYALNDKVLKRYL